MQKIKKILQVALGGILNFFLFATNVFAQSAEFWKNPDSLGTGPQPLYGVRRFDPTDWEWWNRILVVLLIPVILLVPIIVGIIVIIKKRRGQKVKEVILKGGMWLAIAIGAFVILQLISLAL
jgi:hypothetical protein